MNKMTKYLASTQQSFLLFCFVVLVIFACSVATLKQNNSSLIGKQGPAPDTGLKPSLEVITPTRVNANGNFLSHDLSHRHVYNGDELLLHRRRRRRDARERGVGNDLPEDSDDAVLHYALSIQGEKHMIQVEPNHVFLAPHAVVERRTKNNSTSNSELLGSVTSQVSVIGSLPRCHYVGNLVNQTASKVALSTCDGLKGFLKTERGEFLIEPVKGFKRKQNEPHPHAIYRKEEKEHISKDSNCGSDEYEEALRKREIWERDKEKKKENGEGKTDNKIRRKRSVSVERNVEVLVVADKKMIDYYSNEDLNTYILTIMNMVSTIYHDASIGNAVNIIIVRIMLLETPQYEEELEISHNADNTLMSFCQWQHMINPSSEDHPHHHDVAVLLTRYNICSRSNAHCSTLGLAEIAGMCQPHRSCNVNEDTGLQIAYTIAHEIGHNFGMNHDSPINGCGTTYGVGQHVMSPHLATDNIPITWSNCSRNEITKFLDRNWGTCLLDEPYDVQYTFPELPPGAMYDANHQCRLAFGANARHCDGIELECQTLWCRVDNRCVTRLEAAAEGTQCGKHKWCYHGECVTMGERPAAIHGNWGEWSSWSKCSRTCGAGVEAATRHCDNPPPSNGGKYCTGDRRRYRICNTQDCPNNSISFRAIQCSKFDNEPYKGKNYTWRPVTIEEHPCQLHCKPDNEFYSVELKDSVIDGTPCKPGTRDMCIHGVCKRVACDWTIEGSAQEDRCGLCHGDGTQCVTTQGIFNRSHGVSYQGIVTFPVGARNVRIEELGSAANYLAMKDGKSDKFYLNGNWIIQWSGEYNADGVMMYYKRENDTESLFLPGPVVKPLTLMLLFQTKNVGVKWEYTLPHENATYTPEFHWSHSDWSVCTSTCGTGSQVSKAQCMEKESGLVENKYCDIKKKPKHKVRECNTHPCPAWWWSGPWQPCSVTCGEKGKRRRTVICVRSYGKTEQMALMDSDCNMALKPHEEESCPNLHPCITDRSWLASQWLNSCKGDPCEYQKRIVTCIAPKGKCNLLTKPPERRQCGNITCGRWRVGKWEKCSTTCGDGIQIRNVECVGGAACTQSEEPASVQECKLRSCPFRGTLKQDETLVEYPSGELIPPKPDITLQNLTTFVFNDEKKIDLNSTNSTTGNKFIINDINENNITEDYNDMTINETPQLISKDSLGIQDSQNTSRKNSTENDSKYEDEEIPIMLEKEEIPITENVSMPSTYESNKTKISKINENEAEGLINKESIASDQYKENATDGEIKNSPNSSSNVSNYESFPDYESAPDDYYEFDPQEGAASRHSEKKKENGNQTIVGKLIITEEKTKNEIEVGNKENKIDVFKKENEIDNFETGNYNKTLIRHSNVEEKSKILPEINKTENITHNYNDNYDYDEDYYEDEYYYDDYDHNNISTNDTIEERPTGFVEDKIDVEGVQVIEIKLKKNKKNKKGKKGKKESIKKVKVHTGADAIRVLNKFTKKANSKQTTSRMTPKLKKNQDEAETPIYKWEVGSWSQCSEPCGGGVQHRSVECYSSGALVPPWDCLEFPPPDTQHCNMFQCLNWTISEFGPCPVSCGKGTRTRNATCVKEGKCHPRDLPNLQEECENDPCVHWVEGPWSMCTKSCGAGYQIRFVKCVDMRTQEASQDCVEERPAHKRSCNTNKCPEKILGQQNHCKDFLDSTLCKRLVHMCSTKYFKVKCCRTCHRLRG